MTNYIALIMALLLGLLIMITGFSNVFKKKGALKTFFIVVGIIATLYGAIGLLGGAHVLSLGGASGFFLTTVGAPAGNNSVGVTCPIGQVLVNGNCQTPSGNTFLISTLKVKAKEKNSNSYTSVGTGVQYLYIYDKDTNPSSPTASYIDRINLTSGVGTDTSATLQTNTPYRVVFNGAGVWYDKDFGVITFDSNGYNPQTATLSFDMGEVSKIATIGTFLNATAVDGTVNGQTSYGWTTELNDTSSTVVVLNKTVTDGQFYVQPTIQFNGSYAEVHDGVMCFEWDLSNPPAGNEISSISAQLMSGSDFGIPSELVNYWGTQQCVLLGTNLQGGQSSTVKLTFTVNTANLGGTGKDVYYLAIDDLGKLRGTDVSLNTGSPIKRLEFDNIA